MDSQPLENQQKYASNAVNNQVRQKTTLKYQKQGYAPKDSIRKKIESITQKYQIYKDGPRYMSPTLGHIKKMQS